jgi:hypothetical protein
MLIQQWLHVGFRKGIIVPGFELLHESINLEQSSGIHFTGTDQTTYDQSWGFDRGGC